MNPHRPTRARRTVLALAFLAVLAAGCGSSKTKTVTAPAPAASQSSVPTTTTSATTASTPAAPAAASGPGSTATKPGTVLKLGQQGSILDEVLIPHTKKFRHQLVGATLLSVTQGSISDLKNFQLDAQSKVSVPFYVKASFANLSKQPLHDAGLSGYFDVDDTKGDQAQSLSLIGDFPKCDGDIPDTFKAGAKATECDVYMLPKGQRVVKVQFSSGDTSGVTWKVP